MLVNNRPVDRSKEGYLVHNDKGDLMVVQLKASWFDPIPRVTVGNRVVPIAHPLAWYEYLWLGLPIFLLAGGAVGGGIGAFAMFVNARIFRGGESAGMKFMLTGVVSLTAYIVYATIVMAIQPAVPRHH